MPVERAWRRLMELREREMENARHAERRFRIGLWVQTKTMFHVGIMHKQPPETQREYRKRMKIERGKGQPPWGKIEDSRKRRDKHDEQMGEVMEDIWHFEEVFGFANPETGEGHLFPKPPPGPTKEDRAAYYERKNREGTDNVVQMLRMVQEGRMKARENRRRDG